MWDGWIPAGPLTLAMSPVPPVFHTSYALAVYEPAARASPARLLRMEIKLLREGRYPYGIKGQCGTIFIKYYDLRLKTMLILLWSGRRRCSLKVNMRLSPGRRAPTCIKGERRHVENKQDAW